MSPDWELLQGYRNKRERHQKDTSCASILAPYDCDEAYLARLRAELEKAVARSTEGSLNRLSNNWGFQIEDAYYHFGESYSAKRLLDPVCQIFSTLGSVEKGLKALHRRMDDQPRKKWNQVARDALHSAVTTGTVMSSRAGGSTDDENLEDENHGGDVEPDGKRHSLEVPSAGTSPPRNRSSMHQSPQPSPLDTYHTRFGSTKRKSSNLNDASASGRKRPRRGRLPRVSAEARGSIFMRSEGSRRETTGATGYTPGKYQGRLPLPERTSTSAQMVLKSLHGQPQITPWRSGDDRAMPESRDPDDESIGPGELAEEILKNRPFGPDSAGGEHANRPQSAARASDDDVSDGPGNVPGSDAGLSDHVDDDDVRLAISNALQQTSLSGIPDVGRGLGAEASQHPGPNAGGSLLSNGSEIRHRFSATNKNGTAGVNRQQIKEAFASLRDKTAKPSSPNRSLATQQSTEDRQRVSGRAGDIVENAGRTTDDMVCDARDTASRERLLQDQGLDPHCVHSTLVALNPNPQQFVVLWPLLSSNAEDTVPMQQQRYPQHGNVFIPMRTDEQWSMAFVVLDERDCSVYEPASIQPDAEKKMHEVERFLGHQGILDRPLTLKDNLPQPLPQARIEDSGLCAIQYALHLMGVMPLGLRPQTLRRSLVLPLFTPRPSQLALFAKHDRTEAEILENVIGLSWEENATLMRAAEQQAKHLAKLRTDVVEARQLEKWFARMPDTNRVLSKDLEQLCQRQSVEISGILAYAPYLKQATAHVKRLLQDCTEKYKEVLSDLQKAHDIIKGRLDAAQGMEASGFTVETDNSPTP